MKANGEERKIYMTLAMDIEDYIEREKVNWAADGRAEGKAEERREIALRLLQDGLPVEQVARGTGLSVEEVMQLRPVQ